MEQVINVLEARRNARDLVFLRCHLLQFFESIHQQRIDAGKRAGNALLRDREQRFLGLLHNDAQVIRGIVGKRANLTGCTDQITQDGRTLDDLNVVLPIDQGERIAGELQDIRLTANGLKLTRCLQVIGNRNLVEGNMTRIKVEHGLENALMGSSIEVVRDKFGSNVLDGLLVEQARRQHRFLGFYVLRLHFADRGALRHLRGEIGIVGNVNGHAAHPFLYPAYHTALGVAPRIPQGVTRTPTEAPSKIDAMHTA